MFCFIFIIIVSLVSYIICKFALVVPARAGVISFHSTVVVFFFFSVVSARKFSLRFERLFTVISAVCLFRYILSAIKLAH